MLVYTDYFKKKPDTKLIFTLGMFDGVHVGHQSVLNFLNKIAVENGGETALMTFNPHPRFVLQPDTDLKLITTLEEKEELLERFGLQNLYIQDFTVDFSKLTAFEFVRDVLVKELNIDVLVIGYDHQFGKNRDGDFEQLQQFSEMFDFKLFRLPSVHSSEITISSTKIRNQIAEGNIQKANEWLGYEFFMDGKVIYGNQLGRTLGFPTANIGIDSRKITPKNGVYRVKTQVQGQWYNGMMNIGNRPTVDGKNIQLEVHIFDFDQNIYGETIRVQFQEFLREEQKFDNIDALKNQLNLDKKKCLSIVNQL